MTAKQKKTPAEVSPEISSEELVEAITQKVIAAMKSDREAKEKAEAEKNAAASTATPTKETPQQVIKDENGNTIDTAMVNKMARSIALILLGMGIIGLVIYFTAIPFTDLLIFALYWVLPIVAIAMALRLIKAGTFMSIKTFFTHGLLKERIQEYVDYYRKNGLPEQA